MATKNSWEKPTKETDKLTKEQIQLCKFAKYLYRTYKEANRCYRDCSNMPWVDARQYYDGKQDVALFVYNHFIHEFELSQDMLDAVMVG